MKIQERLSLPKEILNIFPNDLKKHLEMLSPDFTESLQEIRVRADKPMLFCDGNKNYFFDMRGNLSTRCMRNAIKVSADDLIKIFERVCEYSVNTHMDEIVNGFVTLSGGHRVGICGRAVLRDGAVRSVRKISSLNIRISRHVKNQVDQRLMGFLAENCSILICGSPSSGKTTMLRQIMSVLTDGKLLSPKKVSVIDERFELDYGVCDEHNCDMLSGFPKEIGILQAIRTLSPDTIILDELGSSDECRGISDGVNCGVNIITTLHCKNINELKTKANVMELINKGVFRYIIFLNGSSDPGQIKDIIKGDEVNDKTDRLSDLSDRVLFSRHV